MISGHVLGYEEVLEAVEKFMIDSGIRDYCTKNCHGQCCYSCFGTDVACHANEGRRLACSVYLCSLNILPAHVIGVWQDLEESIVGSVEGHPYFSIVTSEQKARFNISRSLVRVAIPEPKHYPEIREKLNQLSARQTFRHI